jgi:hypothetical protein
VRYRACACSLLSTLTLLACGGKAVIDAPPGTGGHGATGGGGGGVGAGGSWPVTCAPAVDEPIDGQVAREGPSVLASAADYYLLRGLYAGQPEGERFTVAQRGHVTGVDAALFANDANGSALADVYYLCDGVRVHAASASVAQSELPPYDGMWSDLWLVTFSLDVAVPVDVGTVLDVLFQPETGVDVSAEQQEAYAAGTMIGETEDLSSFGDFQAELLID